MPPVETELKFEAPDGAVPPLPEGLATVGPEHTITLVATYWDSGDRDLLAHGVTLRHRTASDGSEEGWTLKVPAPTAAAGVARTELSAPGAPTAPPAQLTGIVRSVVDADALSPTAELTTTRRIRSVGVTGGRAVVELTDDEVQARVGGEDRPAFREIEVEAVSPDGIEVLARIDAEWSEAGMRSSRSKLARALGEPRQPEPATPSTVGPFVTGLFAEGLRQLIDHELRFRVDPADSEAVHQARVATRRLRSNLKTFRPLLDRTVTDPLRIDLRWIGRLLGQVRDAQVLVLRLDELTAARDLDDDGLGELRRIVGGELEVAEANLTSALGGDRYLQLVRRLRGASRRPPIRSDVRADAKARRAVREVVRHRWKRLRRTIGRLEVDPSDVELHDARKEVKHVRYALQAVKPLGVEGPGLVKALGRVQDELGELHDAVELRAWLRRRRPQLDVATSFLAGQLDQVAAEEALRRRESWGSRWEAAQPIRVS